MTLNEYAIQKFQSFGITLSEADLLELSLNSGLGSDAEVSNSNLSAISAAIAGFIPSLLMRATSISESGFSMSWDVEGIKRYYAYLCHRLGIKDELDTNKPKVSFL